MQIWSGAFAEGEQIPLKYSRDGDNISPPLRWSDVPENARELALVFENITPATQEPFAQWVVYGISPAWGGLPEGFKHKRDPEAPQDVRQGTNDIGNVGYDGPQGSVGHPVRYRFRLLALDDAWRRAPMGTRCWRQRPIISSPKPSSTQNSSVPRKRPRRSPDNNDGRMPWRRRTTAKQK